MNYPRNYGPATTETVRQFQEYYGLKVTGIADSKTLDKLDEVLKNSLKQGDVSAEVQQLKEDLNRIGISVGMNYPQSYGPATEEAVRKFQDHYNLKVTGVADPKTLTKLRKVDELILKRNDNSAIVEEFKENLNEIGFFVSMNYPRNYGPATEGVVREFQEYYGLDVTGNADKNTLNKLFGVIRVTLKEGDNSEAVKELKEALNKLGFSVGMNYPRNYGPATTETVRQFQEYYGLKVTGIADSKTLDKLDEVLKNSLKQGDVSAEVQQLKEDLNRIGISVGMNYPQSYGPATEE